MHRFSDEVSIVLGGAAGQGVQTVEALLMQVLKREGYQVFASKEYMSRIRGGSNSTEIRLTTKPRQAFTRKIDLLFAMDKAALAHLHSRISKNTIVLGEKAKISDTDCHVVDVPFTSFGSELGNPIYTSTVAVGVVLGMLQAEESVLHDYLREHFAKKGEEVVAKNIEAAKKGYTHGRHICFVEGIEIAVPRTKRSRGELLLQGSDALGLGVLAAGCNFVSSYPMSPGTALLTFLAQNSEAMRIVVDQTEDEVGAINMAIGAWYAGARAIVSTSGGGFALMCEGVSLSGMIETPVVVHVGMRPGPATGLPTRTEQGDLNLVLYAGHGEFPRAIYAPGTPTEAFQTAQEAFRVADKFQIPVFLLTDTFFLDQVNIVKEADLVQQPVENHIVETKEGYKRYVLAKEGISPRGIPGYGKGLVGVDSDEHDEEAHITESAEVRVAMHEKRLKKLEGLKKEALPPVVTGDPKKAKCVVVTWGSNYGVVAEALAKMEDDYFVHAHFPQVYPLSESGNKLFPKTKEVVVVENNHAGQFANLLEREYDITVKERILRYDGAPFAVEDLMKRLQKLT